MIFRSRLIGIKVKISSDHAARVLAHGRASKLLELRIVAAAERFDFVKFGVTFGGVSEERLEARVLVRRAGNRDLRESRRISAEASGPVRVDRVLAVGKCGGRFYGELAAPAEWIARVQSELD